MTILPSRLLACSVAPRTIIQPQRITTCTSIQAWDEIKQDMWRWDVREGRMPWLTDKSRLSDTPVATIRLSLVTITEAFGGGCTQAA